MAYGSIRLDSDRTYGSVRPGWGGSALAVTSEQRGTTERGFSPPQREYSDGSGFLCGKDQEPNFNEWLRRAVAVKRLTENVAVRRGPALN